MVNILFFIQNLIFDKVIYILYSWDMNIKLTKKEKNFLFDWLSDDLDLATREKQDRANSKADIVISNLSSILKKLTKEQ